jgi:DnaJ-domain-containing protein 1
MVASTQQGGTQPAHDGSESGVTDDIRSILGDISVGADKKRRMRKRGFTGNFEHSQRACEWPDCEEKGDHRAPKSPDLLNEFRWFCATHIREYNKSWDFYAGMSPDQIEKAREKDRRWDRPTWEMKGAGKPKGVSNQPHAEGKAWERFGYKDPHEVLGENATINPGESLANDARKARRRLLPKADIKALEALDLDVMATADEVRERYKTLVKELHPDMNGGDRSEEDRLQKAVAAWNHLKKTASFRR